MAKKESTKTATKAKATKTAAKPTPAKKTAKASATKARPTAKAQSKKSEARSADNFFTETYLETARNTLVNAIGYLEDVRDYIDEALASLSQK